MIEEYQYGMALDSYEARFPKEGLLVLGVILFHVHCCIIQK
jgi:hypothetical protein